MPKSTSQSVKVAPPLPDPLDTVIATIRKAHGAGSIFRLSDMPELAYQTTGFPMVDSLLGGGLPIGRITHLYAPAEAPKTELALYIMAQVTTSQDVMYVNAEHGIDKTTAKKFGVDTSKVLVSQALTGEDMMEDIFTVVRQGVGLVVVDTVAALIPSSEWEQKNGFDKVTGIAPVARLLSRKLPILASLASKSNVPILLLNQVRANPMASQYMDPYSAPGGHQLASLATHTIQLYHSKWHKDVGIGYFGEDVAFKIAHSKLLPPRQAVVLTYVNDHGWVLDGNVAPYRKKLLSEHRSKVTTVEVVDAVSVSEIDEGQL
jgi:recombination protein RecA